MVLPGCDSVEGALMVAVLNRISAQRAPMVGRLLKVTLVASLPRNLAGRRSAGPLLACSIMASARATAGQDHRMRMGRRRPPPDSDDDLFERLRGGDEEAFIALVGRYNHALFWAARSFVPSDAVAEEVVQDTWMAVVRGLSQFEGRSSIKTWLVSIAVNRARSTGARESRVLTLSASEAAVDTSRFDTRGQWITPPQHFVEDAEDRISAGMLTETICSSLENLPEGQRQVVTLRDVEGLNSKEVCQLLEISEGNQRVLLHRGRSRLRQDLETKFGGIQ
jgi:RNA polymerase sigma-70 factor, ECF subfamily